MSLHVTREDVPGHDVTAEETGWKCICGAGHEWEQRPRVRAVSAAKRHLTAAARPPGTATVTETDKPAQPAQDPAPEAPAADPPAPAGPDYPTAHEHSHTPAQPAPAPVSLIDQFRSPPRDPE